MNTLWFSSPPASPITENANPYGQHGIAPCASHMEQGASLITELPPSDLVWNLDHSGGAEATSIHIRFDDGSYGYGICAYSTLGFSPSIQSTWKFWSPSNGECQATNTFSGNSNFKLSNDRCSVTVNAQNTWKMSVGPDGKPEYDIEIFPKDKSLGVRIKFRSLTAACQIKDGKTHLKPLGHNSEYHFRHQFLPLGSVDATLINGKDPEKKLTGYASIVRGLQSTKPHIIATRWDFCQMVDGDAKNAILLVQCKTPRAFSKQAISQAVVVQNGQIVCCSTRALLRHETTEVDKSNGYNLPKTMEFKIEGETRDGKSFLCSSMIESKSLIVRFDILAELPYLVRKILQALIAKPFMYAWFDENKFQMTTDGVKTEFTGLTYHETNFINLEK